MEIIDKINEQVKSLHKKIEKIKNCYSFISSIITELEKIETNYQNSLQRLYCSIKEINFPKNFKVISVFLKDSIKTKFNLQKNSVLSMQSKILYTINTLLPEITNMVNKTENDFPLNRGKIVNIKNNILKLKNVYYASAQKYENKLIEINCKMNNKGIKDMMNSVKINENNYLNEIKTFNECKNEYYSNGEKNINQLNEIINFSSENLKKMFSFYFKDTIYFSKSIINVFEAGNELCDFIDLQKYKEKCELKSASIFNENKEEIITNEVNKNDSKPKNSNEIEFEPYTISLIANNKNLEYDNLSLKVIKHIKNNLLNSAKNFNLSEEEDKCNFKVLTDVALYGNISTIPKEKSQLISYIRKSKYYRRRFLFNLNALRIMGKFENKKVVIELVAEILKIILDKFPEDKDYELMKILIILSQTFYYMEKNVKKDLFLLISDYPLFKNIEFYLGFTVDLIEKELKDLQDKHYVSLTCFSQLIAVVNNMIIFQNTKNDIFQVADGIQIKYNIPEETMQGVYDLIEDSFKKKNVQEEHKIDNKKRQKIASVLTLTFIENQIGRIHQKYQDKDEVSGDNNKEVEENQNKKQNEGNEYKSYDLDDEKINENDYGYMENEKGYLDDEEK